MSLDDQISRKNEVYLRSVDYKIMKLLPTPVHSRLGFTTEQLQEKFPDENVQQSLARLQERGWIKYHARPEWKQWGTSFEGSQVLILVSHALEIENTKEEVI